MLWMVYSEYRHGKGRAAPARRFKDRPLHGTPIRAKVHTFSRSSKPFTGRHAVVKSLVAGTCWLLVMLPAPGQAPTEKEAIQKVLDDQVVAWNKGDLEGFMTGYWK